MKKIKIRKQAKRYIDKWIKEGRCMEHSSNLLMQEVMGAIQYHENKVKNL